VNRVRVAVGVGVAMIAMGTALVACSKSQASTGDGSIDAGATFAASDPVIEALWARARGDAGEPDDLARLADREGASGLVARANADPASRLTALRALAYAPEPQAWEGLPLLAEAARAPSDDEANAALDSAIDLAARPRRATDPEDAAELKQGCDGLLAIAVARDGKGAMPRARRVKAIRALRLLADRGCVDAAAIPGDADAR
jgi:hypothetical protein